MGSVMLMRGRLAVCVAEFGRANGPCWVCVTRARWATRDRMLPGMEKSQLYFGDNLDGMWRYLFEKVPQGA